MSEILAQLEKKGGSELQIPKGQFYDCLSLIFRAAPFQVSGMPSFAFVGNVKGYTTLNVSSSSSFYRITGIKSDGSLSTIYTSGSSEITSRQMAISDYDYVIIYLAHGSNMSMNISLA